ncbi:MAG: protein translocase subunit SecF [Gemmatimonadota bacterium]
MFRPLANANYKIIEIRRIAYVITAAALLASLGMAIFWQVTKGSWLNYGVDFAGGILVQVRFSQPTSVADLRTQIEARIPRTEITRFGAENEFLIRAPRFTEAGESVADQIVSILRQQPNRSFEVARTEAVSAKVGSELQRKAIIAILLSFAATLIYLAFRFEWRFGLAAIAATMHDTLLTLGLISAFRMEVSLTTVAAILTIVGYSLNDTIVIFDRIRENLKKSGRRVELVPLLNRSINETLPRTVLTGGSVIATLTSLALLGGSTIRGFALIMLIGVLIGTYSSVFVASPVLYEIEKRWGIKKADKPSRQQRVAL